MPVRQTPIQKAVKVASGQASLARAINVPPALVWQWVNGKRPVAPKHALAIESATGGKVTRYQIAPDVFGTDARAVNASESSS